MLDSGLGAVARVAAGVAAWRGRAGSGASRCTFGNAKSGNAIAGTDRPGSAVVFAGSAGWPKLSPIGAAYMATSTVRPKPAHQYRTPRKRNAINPYG